MLSVYVGKLLPPRFHHLEFLYPNLGFSAETNDFGEPNPFLHTNSIVKTVSSPYEADAYLLPYGVRLAEKEGSYLSEFLRMIEEVPKPLIVCAYGDSPEPSPVPAAIVLRTSAYRSTLQKNELLVPPHIPDVGKLYGVLPKQKEDAPTVAFCGYAAFPSMKARLTFFYKNTLAGIGAVFSDSIAVRRQGIYFRKKAMRALSGTSRIQTKFITRSFYSGSRKTIGMDAKVARREYVENMQSADLALAPKGDGNYSLRFYEALSLGRIPILIDTDTPLPGNEEWYKDAVVRVSWKDIETLPEIVTEWFASISNDEFILMQERARTLFTDHLFAPQFYTELFIDIEKRIKTM